MKTSGNILSINSSQDEVFDALVNQMMERLEGGESVELDDYVTQHPAYAERLKKLWPTLRALADFERSVAGHLSSSGDNDSPTRQLTGTLGDFQIIREIGRGGMGIVYEAEQISLNRRVALKVLPFAATMDPRHLQRFKNEAMAVASLDHPHIVDVHGVGVERGVHYYAMRLIEGHTLAEVIAQLRQLQQQDGRMPESVSGVIASADEQFAPPQSSGEISTRISPNAETKPVVQAGIATQKSALGLKYFRSVAALAIKVAEALDHAHQEGIVHRDIKPSNLLLDVRGKVWVTDFGLAQIETGGDLTMTGDLIGTLRYMSPEQALAKRVVMDHRSDIYSFGATLYELLTLHPTVSGDDREEILHAIAIQEPRKPSQFNRSIPTDLETVILKAIEKKPEDRYVSAQEMADDLRRFHETKPVLAKRSGYAKKLGKWAQRHRGLVASLFAFLLLSVMFLAVMLVIVDNERSEKQQAFIDRGEALHQKDIALVAQKNALKAKEAALKDALDKEALARKEWLRAERNTLAIFHQAGYLLEYAKDRYKRGDYKKAKRLADACAEIMKTIYTSDLAKKRISTKNKLIALRELIKKGISSWPSAVEEFSKRIDSALQIQKFGAYDNSTALSQTTNELIELYLDEGSPFFKLPNVRVDAVIMLMHSLRNQGRVFRQLGKPEKAEAAFVQSLKYLEIVAKISDPALFSLWKYELSIRLNDLGLAQLNAERYQDAEMSFREARNTMSLIPGEPFVNYHQFLLARLDYYLANICTEKGQHNQAKILYQKALKTLDKFASEAEFAWDHAWFLLTCPEKSLRDPKRAFELAKKLKEPRDKVRILQLAYYRLGDYKAANQESQKSRVFKPIFSPVESVIHGTLIPGMINAKLKILKRGKVYYQNAIEYVRKHEIQHYDVRLFLREASAVIRVDAANGDKK